MGSDSGPLTRSRLSGSDAPVIGRFFRAVARDGPLGLIPLIRKNIVYHYRLAARPAIRSPLQDRH